MRSPRNNLKQLGLALHNYHDTNKKLPPGGTDAAAPRYVRMSGFVNMMPFYEEQALHDAFDLAQSIDHANNANARAKTVAMLFCPSRRAPVVGQTGWYMADTARGDYAFSVGGDGSHTNSTDAAKVKGLFGLESKLNFASVTDGLSKTIAIGEKRVEKYTGDSGGTNGAADGPHYRWGYHASRNMKSPMNSAVVSGAFDDNDANFGSSHAAKGGHFLFADGSVQYLNQNINLQIYQDLANRADGKAVSIP